MSNLFVSNRKIQSVMDQAKVTKKKKKEFKPFMNDRILIKKIIKGRIFMLKAWF